MTKPSRDFALEVYFSRWEFKAKYHLTASDAQSLSLEELLALASAEDRRQFGTLWLGYTETWGSPALRAVIAGTFDAIGAEEILTFAGAQEAVYVAMSVLLERGDHAIVLTPNYQSAETVPLSICDTSGVALDAGNGWSLLATEWLPETLGAHELIVQGRDPDKAEQLASRVRSRGGQARRARDVAELLAAANVVVTATCSERPLFSAQQVSRGTHIVALGADSPGKQELPHGLYDRRPDGHCGRGSCDRGTLRAASRVLSVRWPTVPSTPPRSFLARSAHRHPRQIGI